MSIERNGNRAADHVPLRDSAAAVVSTQQANRHDINGQNRSSPRFMRNSGSFGPGQIYREDKERSSNRMLPTPFGDANDTKADRSRFAVSVPPRYQVPKDGTSPDLYSSFGLEYMVELRLS